MAIFNSYVKLPEGTFLYGSAKLIPGWASRWDAYLKVSGAQGCTRAGLPKQCVHTEGFLRLAGKG